MTAAPKRERAPPMVLFAENPGALLFERVRGAALDEIGPPVFDRLGGECAEFDCVHPFAPAGAWPSMGDDGDVRGDLAQCASVAFDRLGMNEAFRSHGVQVFANRHIRFLRGD